MTYQFIKSKFAQITFLDDLRERSIANKLRMLQIYEILYIARKVTCYSKRARAHTHTFLSSKSISRMILKR